MLSLQNILFAQVIFRATILILLIINNDVFIDVLPMIFFSYMKKAPVGVLAYAVIKTWPGSAHIHINLGLRCMMK